MARVYNGPRRYESDAAELARGYWQELFAAPPPYVACDVETRSLKDRTIIGIGVAMSLEVAFYVTADDDSYQPLLNLLCYPGITKIWHNAPFDLRALRDEIPDLINIEDTAILLRTHGHDAVLEQASGGISSSAKDFLAQYNIKTMDQADVRDVGYKCTQDVLATFWVWDKYQHYAASEVYQLDKGMVRQLELVSRRGILLDKPVVNRLYREYSTEASYFRALADGYEIPFNPGSNKEVGYVLSSLGAILPYTKTWQLAVGKDVLRKMRGQPAIVAGITLNYRHASKMLGTYVEPFVDQNRAYAGLHLSAITGRINGTSAGDNQPDRNLLNIPKKAESGNFPTIRSCMLPDSGLWLKADASQVELRILAFLSGDAVMQAAFDEGRSLHEDTQQRTGLTYDLAKIFNYSLSYGADDQTIADGCGINDLQIVRDARIAWSRAYPKAWAWLQRQSIQGMREGYAYTITGRKMKIPLDRGEKHAMNCAVNFPIQGTAADVLKLQFQVICQAGLFENLKLPVHDEFLMDGDVSLPLEDLAEVTEIFTPLTVKRVQCWE